MSALGLYHSNHPYPPTIPIISLYSINKLNQHLQPKRKELLQGNCPSRHSPPLLLPSTTPRACPCCHCDLFTRRPEAQARLATSQNVTSSIVPGLCGNHKATVYKVERVMFFFKVLAKPFSILQTLSASWQNQLNKFS